MSPFLRLFASLILVTLIFVPVKSSSAAPDDYWWDGFASGPSGVVLAMAVYDGDLYIGGAFSSVAGVSASNIARWNGTSWSAVGSGVDDTVHALYVFGGELLIGGEFIQAGTTTVNRLARWNGSSLLPLNGGFDGPVYDIGEFGGFAVATGFFNTAGGLQARNIARSFGFTWAPMGSGLSSLGRTLYEASDGTLYAGGGFFSAGGKTVSSVASWNGNEWNELGDGLAGGFQSQPFVEAFVEFQGDIIAGGRFDTAGGVDSPYLARWNGSTWSPVGEGIGADGLNALERGVYSLDVFNGELVASGLFNTAGGDPVSNVARFDGLTWRDLGSGLDDAAFTAQVYDGSLHLGGRFTQAGPEASQRLARWDAPAPTTAPAVRPASLRFANPVVGTTRLSLQVPRAGRTRLALYDLQGRLVTTVLEEQLPAGSHSMLWATGNLSAGVYMMRLEAGPSPIARKLIVR